ncbi:glycosyl transferase family 1 [Rhodosalinus sp.]|uniref:rhamnosyltransferase WsaF family glycosyltransferase n=1 Tax=Rhodosalinus sp. TaxID=2047741 RepID=UPI003563091E
MTRQIVIVMAVHRPTPAYLRVQLQSLAAQTQRPSLLVAVISDRVSGPLVTTMAGETGLPLTLVDPGEQLDAVRAFEAGLAEALELTKDDPDAVIALSDQDDIWKPERLNRGLAALDESGADLVHGDARLVSEDGAAVLHESMFRFERRHRRPGLRGLLYRNNVTGMTTLMRRRLVELALPFPAQSGVHFYHDLWLALLASALGGVQLVREPLVDYRQHDANAIGAVDRQAGWLRPGLLRRMRGADEMWLRREAASYALARYLAQSAHNRMVDAVADGRVPHGRARLGALRPFLKRFGGTAMLGLDSARLMFTGHMGLARIAGGFAIVSVARLVWILRDTMTGGLDDARDRFDERLYSLSPGLPPEAPQAVASETRRKPVAHTELVDDRKRPRWRPDFTRDDPAVCVLVPTLNPAEVFAGVATALDLGLGLAARGHRVQFIATDLPISSRGTSLRFVRRRLDGRDAATRVTVHCGVKDGTIPAHRADRFVATAWWSAHVADRLIRHQGYLQQRFVYLIQDFEPAFYPWGSEYADAMASYALEFQPVFNTESLRAHFAQSGFAFAGPDALAFQPAIDVTRYAAGARVPRDGRKRKLALYGRPEVARNMYPTAIEALARFIEAEQLGPDDIEMVSVGLRHDDVALPRGVVLRSLGKLPWEDYPVFLRGVDIGLSLMHSPHPSHPPIEMAASGVRVVANRFGAKDLGTLTSAILSVEPTVEALTGGLRRAWGMGPVSDEERRIDLGQLGLPFDTMLDRLSTALAPATQDMKGR